MQTLREFLTERQEKLADILCYPGVHLVIGNESCDLDSMVSCFALAYLYHLTKYKSGHVTVFPVMNVISNEFPARTLNNYLLNKYNILVDSLIFRNNINFEELVANQGLRVSLVDHHVLPENLDFLKPCVVDIFDHRPIDESEVWDEHVQIIIEEVGSCATLIALQLLTTLEKCTCLKKNDIIFLLRDTIIFDTIGLDPKALKVTSRDLEVFQEIEEILEETVSVKSAYKELWDAHKNTSGLTTFQLLVKDIKCISDVYIPGLPMLVQTFLKRGDVKHALHDFYYQKNASLVVLMGIECTHEVRRDIALYAPEKQNRFIGIVRSNLLTSNLDLEEMPCNNSKIMYFRQNNIALSRKQVIPIIKESIQTK